MCKGKNGKPKRSSRFICIYCGKENMPGIQRRNMRQKEHIKTMYCPFCKIVTQNVEVRYMDNFEEIKEDVPQLRNIYYEELITEVKYDECDCENSNSEKL